MLLYLIALAIRDGDLSQTTLLLDDTISPRDVEFMSRLCVIYERQDILHHLHTTYHIDRDIRLIRELIHLSSAEMYPYVIALLFHSHYPIIHTISTNQCIRAIQDGRIREAIGYTSYTTLLELMDYPDVMNAMADVGDIVGIGYVLDMITSGNVAFVHHVCFFDQLMVRGAHNIEIVHLMLSLGASSYRDTCYSAARSGNLEVVRLMEKSILKNTKPRHHYTELLSHSIESIDIVSYVLGKKVVTTETLLYSLREAIEHGSLDALILISSHLQDINREELVRLAAISGELPCMMYLLGNSVPSTISIHLALEKGYIYEVIYLLSTYQHLYDDWKIIVESSHEYIYYVVR